ncbi:hypothetical protein [Homoserinibacter sp. YIM 151385]|uniref:hypothetical protein n=1 Tax=Homoserinibacter sp. YIM 151385 TaxID=2985506 RepID=UPI0022F044A0|nr:hypothetical protein [Homoserinibacter sp. YIM 151385]WBU37965.1 hypothetical protein OF852_13785 [Homoserinibacter sp. YIM 151385]
MTGPSDVQHDEQPLDPAAALAIIEGERRSATRSAIRQVPVYYYVWGGAWLVGYLVLWASWRESGAPVHIPGVVAVPVFAALIIAGVVVSMVVGIRSNRGMRGQSSFVGMVYGWSWTILGVGAAAIGMALIRNGMPPELAALYFPSAYALVLAALYLAGAMLWGSIDQLVIAVVVAIAGSVSPFFGAPANYLAMALIAGGALLAGGVVASIRMRRLA